MRKQKETPKAPKLLRAKEKNGRRNLNQVCNCEQEKYPKVGGLRKGKQEYAGAKVQEKGGQAPWGTAALKLGWSVREKKKRKAIPTVQNWSREFAQKQGKETDRGRGLNGESG